jgi:putative hydroxymethylpyrimidine transport system substrate-binding protein
LRLRSRPSATLAIALATLAGAVLAGCGEKDETTSAGSTEPFTLALDFYVNPDHAGIYTALERGYFEQAGLDVQPQVPSDPAAPIKQVAAGRADLAISYEPEVILARDQGLPVKAVAALVPSPLTSLISLPEAKIRDVADLRGKTVATAGIPYQTDFLETMLDEAGVPADDVEQVDVGLNLLPAVLSGRADAILGGFLNVEGVDLSERGKDPRVVPVDELGVPTYDELVLVANEDTVDDPESIRLFIAALERGTQDAVDDPAMATDAVLAAGDGLDPKLTQAEIDATLPLLVPDTGNHPYGYMDPQEWDEFAGFFADRGLIERRPTADDLLTNALLPGEIPD